MPITSPFITTICTEVELCNKFAGITAVNWLSLTMVVCNHVPVSCRLPLVVQKAVLEMKCPEFPKFDPLIVMVISGLPAATVEGEIEAITTGGELLVPPPLLLPLFPLLLLPGIAELQPIVSNKQRKVKQARTVFMFTSQTRRGIRIFYRTRVPDLQS